MERQRRPAQHCVNQEEHRKPIVFFGESTGGRFLIVINPFVGLT